MRNRVPSNRLLNIKSTRTPVFCEDPELWLETEVLEIPERTLLAAILWRAVWDLKASEPHVARGARAFFALDPKPKADPRFTYFEICEALDLDPNVLLRILKDLGLI